MFQFQCFSMLQCCDMFLWVGLQVWVMRANETLILQAPEQSLKYQASCKSSSERELKESLRIHPFTNARSSAGPSVQVSALRSRPWVIATTLMPMEPRPYEHCHFHTLPTLVQTAIATMVAIMIAAISIVMIIVVVKMIQNRLSTTTAAATAVMDAAHTTTPQKPSSYKSRCDSQGRDMSKSGSFTGENLPCQILGCSYGT